MGKATYVSPGSHLAHAARPRKSRTHLVGMHLVRGRRCCGRPGTGTRQLAGQRNRRVVNERENAAQVRRQELRDRSRRLL